MADPVIRLTLGDETFTLRGVTVQEMSRVKAATEFKNRRAWFDAIGDEDPDALVAAYMLVKQRKGEKVRFNDVDFDLDQLGAAFVDEEGREVEPLIEKKADGTVKTDKDGNPVAVLDKNGHAQWVYVDTGDAVPPTEAT